MPRVETSPELAEKLVINCVRRGLTGVMSILLLLSCRPVIAGGDEDTGRVPSNATEEHSPIAKAFSRPDALPASSKPTVPQIEGQAPSKERNVLLDDLKDRLRDTDPFLRDTQVDLYFRSYYFDRKNLDGARSRAWAGGSALSYRSGYYDGWLQLGAAVASSQPLLAPQDEAGSLLLDPDQDEMTTLLAGYARLRGLGHEVTAGRQLIKMPYLNPRDSRMLPISFEGVVVSPRRDRVGALDYTAGYVWRFKPRDDPDFLPLSKGLGVEEDHGAVLGGFKYKPMPGLTFGATDYLIADTLNTAYAELDWTLPASNDKVKYRFNLNYTDQRSVGADLISGEETRTDQVSSRFVMSIGHFTVGAAVSVNDERANILSPFGSFANYTDLDQTDFDRAGEKALVIGAAYDFSDLIAEGFKIQVRYGWGIDGINPTTGNDLADRDELILHMDYDPTSGALSDFRFQAYFTTVGVDHGVTARDDQPNLRIIGNYVIPLL